MDKRVFYTLNIAVFTSMLGMGIVLPFMPIYARSLGATGITIGIFFASFPLAQMVFMPMIGRLSDRHGRKMFMALGPAGQQPAVAVVRVRPEHAVSDPGSLFCKARRWP